MSALDATTGRRTLEDLVRTDAPLPARRAAAVLVPVARELVRRTDRSGADGPATPDGSRLPLASQQVVVLADGSVELDLQTAAPLDAGVAGATLGRLLFELLVGRPPLSGEDAFEPHLRRELEPAVVALVASSCAAAPGQWPPPDRWLAVLEQLAGSYAPSEQPSVLAARRRRRAAFAVALALLVAVCVAVVLMAPRWWDTATESGAPSEPAAQASAAS